MSRPLADPLLSSRWDSLGIGLSGLCAAHCTLTPVLLAVLPLYPSLYAIHSWLHPLLLILLVPVAVVALGRTRPERRPRAVPALLATGLMIVFLAWLSKDALGLWGEAGVTLAGSALLVLGHWKNGRCHGAQHAHDDSAI